jgi:hypothetical protein
MVGFGQGAWGQGAWGGATSSVQNTLVYDTLTLGESLSIGLSLKVLGAFPLTAYIVEVYFSHDLDPSYLPNFTAGNYTIVPSLTVNSASYGSSQNVIRLHTDEQGAVIYTVTVAQAQSIPGDPLDPLFDEAVFAGFPIAPNFFAAAQSRRKVELIFSTAMLVNSAFTNPTNYTIEDFNGNAVTVVSATASGLSPISQVTLELSSELTPGGYYVATVSPNVKTAAGYTISPPTDVFQWNEMQAPVRRGPVVIPIEDFSGEVTSGLLGQPAGQIFFSPALEQSAADSIIQVDSASVCTKAYDEYSFPELEDPPPLFTYAPGASESLLNQSSLWTTAERQGLPRINLSNSPEDTAVVPVDGPAIATLEEPVDYSRAGFLNDYEILLKGDPPTVRSHLYDGTGKTLICADNLTPVGPGPSVEVILQDHSFSEVLGLSESLTVS